MCVAEVPYLHIKSVLTQKGLDIFCHKFYIPEDVHPQLPSPNQTIHEMPTGKIGVYTRFFEYANFRLPLSTFLVNVLRHYRINLSQLSIIAAAKVNSNNKGWMSFSKRPDSDAVCYTKPLDSLKHWNDHFFWVDSFACPASFPWHTDKNVSRDHFPKSTEFNANDYVVLVAHPAPFRMFLGPFLYMNLFAFIQVADPTKVKVLKRERAEGEAKLLDSTVGRVVPLLPVSLARAESELEASVDKLFNKDGSADQVDSAASGCQDAETELVTGVKIIANENVIAERPKHQRKKRPAVSVAAMATLPLVTSLISTTSECESGAPTDSIIGLNLCTIGASKKFVISSDASYHSSTHASGAKVDSIIRSIVLPPVMTEAVVTSHAASDPPSPVSETGVNITSPVHASMFHDSDSTETMRADVMGPSYSAKQDLSMGSQELNAETLHQIYKIDYHHLFTEFNVGTTRQACLNAEVRDDEVENLKAQLPLKETEAAEAARLRA
ncbi:hypothetical protein Tco_1247720 [Tanacetum coccineum]